MDESERLLFLGEIALLVVLVAAAADVILRYSQVVVVSVLVGIVLFRFLVLCWSNRCHRCLGLLGITLWIIFYFALVFPFEKEKRFCIMRKNSDEKFGTKK